MLVVSTILLFINKCCSVRQIRYAFNTEPFIDNLSLLSGSKIERIASPNTLGTIMKMIATEDLHRIQRKMINKLLRMKALKQYRLLGQYYTIAIDMTGNVSFKSKHCPHCLTKKRDGEIYCWYHPVVEAKLVTGHGLALSADSEFAENTEENQTVQDCELRAMYRLIERLKKNFPQLKICVLLDGLYANAPVIELITRYKWECIITFKKGSLPDLWRDYQGLKKLQPKNIGLAVYKKKQNYCSWVNGFEYANRDLSALETIEQCFLKETKTFVWLTTLPVRRDNYIAIMKGGRSRWTIENQGFNMQKTGGYNLEHTYSKDTVGIKNFYLVMQIAHTINQLMEKGNLLSKVVRSALQSIKNIATQLLEELRTKHINNISLGTLKIRLDTS